MPKKDDFLEKLEIIMELWKDAYKLGWNNAMRRANAPYVKSPTANDY